MWTIISGIFGGLLRLAPEILKFLDAKNDRKHELDMQEAAYKFQALKGDQRMDEIGAENEGKWNAGALDALSEAIKSQAAPSGVLWIDGLSKLIRPLITVQWVILLYPAVLIASFTLAVQGGTSPLVALLQVFGETERSIVMFIIDFWFIGRVLERKR